MPRSINHRIRRICSRIAKESGEMALVRDSRLKVIGFAYPDGTFRPTSEHFVYSMLFRVNASRREFLDAGKIIRGIDADLGRFLP